MLQNTNNIIFINTIFSLDDPPADWKPDVEIDWYVIMISITITIIIIITIIIVNYNHYFKQ